MKNIFFLIFFTLSLTINLTAAGKTFTLTVDSPTVIESIGIFDLNVRVEPKLRPGDVINFTYSTQDGTATGGNDYTSISNATKQITNGDNTGSSTIATVPITILNDGLSGEGNEAFNIIINSASIADTADTVIPNNTGGIVTITDDDTATLPTLSINDVSVNENAGTATFKASISPTSTSDVIFAYSTVDGTAVGGIDYTISSDPNMVISAGNSFKNISIPIIDDIEAGEGSETFSVFLNNANNAIIGDNEGIGTIVDDDTGLTASINDASIAEGDVDITVVVKVVFSQPISADMNFTYNTIAGSATDGLDYTGVVSGTANVPAGATEHNLTLTILGDTLAETPEDFIIKISNFTDATLVIAKDAGTVTIFDNDTTSACSSYIGLMTINEYQNNPHYFDLNHQKVTGNYVEIKYIDFLVKQFVTDFWEVNIYTTAGNQGILWRDRDLECIDPRYEIFQFGNNVMGAQGYVVLTDQNGNEVDVLNIDNSNHYAQSCHNFPYDTDFDSSAQNKDLFRLPDGTGDWTDTGQGANSVGTRCQGYGEGAGVLFTEFEAMDVENITSDGVQPLPTPGFTGAPNETPIKTKVVNELFDLNVLWLNLSATPVVIKSSGTVDINVYLGYVDAGGAKILPGTNPPKLIQFSNNGQKLVSTNNSKFIYDKAAQNVRAVFEYCIDENRTIYPLLDCQVNPDYNLTLSASRNTFAIRPDNFHIDDNPTTTHYPDLLRAGQEYNLTIHAYDYQDNDSNDYNQTRNNIDLNVTRYFNDDTIGDSTLFGDLAWTATTNFNMTNGISLFNASNEVAGLQYSDIGKVNILLRDKDWASEDALSNGGDTLEDCNATVHSTICEETPPVLVRYIPHHFTLTNSVNSNENSYLYNHAQKELTYLSSDLNMSAHIDVTISAMNANGAVTQNFHSGKAKYYENEVSVDLNVTTWKGTPSLHPTQNVEIIHDISTAQILGFGGTETNGTHTIPWNETNATQQLMFNYERENNGAVNPFIVDGNETNLTVESVYPQPGDDPIVAAAGTATIQGDSLSDSNATFAFARAKSSQFFYDNITTSVQTPISVVVYCDTWPTCPELNNEIKINEPYWWLAVEHDEATGDGNITLISPPTVTIGAGNPTITPDVDVTVIPTQPGVDTDVYVNSGATTSLPMTVEIFLDTTPTTDTNSWLIYNTESDILDPDPFYRVRFIGQSGWTGHGKTGHVVDSNASKKINKRLSW